MALAAGAAMSALYNVLGSPAQTPLPFKLFFSFLLSLFFSPLVDSLVDYFVALSRDNLCKHRLRCFAAHFARTAVSRGPAVTPRRPTRSG
jgi:hypothetical protein